MKKTTALMSQKSPIFKYAKKKGITEHAEHDILLDILKAGRKGKKIEEIKKSVKEFANEIPRILPSLIQKGVVINKGQKYIGIFASKKDDDDVLYKALAKSLEV